MAAIPGDEGELLESQNAPLFRRGESLTQTSSTNAAFVSCCFVWKMGFCGKIVRKLFDTTGPEL